MKPVPRTTTATRADKPLVDRACGKGSNPGRSALFIFSILGAAYEPDTRLFPSMIHFRRGEGKPSSRSGDHPPRLRVRGGAWSALAPGSRDLACIREQSLELCVEIVGSSRNR